MSDAVVGPAGATTEADVRTIAVADRSAFLPEGSEPAPAKSVGLRRRTGDRLRWVFRRRLCFGGLAGAVVFFGISLTPSLLPRTVAVQGLVCGIATVIGYGIGSALSAGLRKLVAGEPGRRAKRIAWRVLVGAAVIFVPLFLVLGRSWQDDVRQLMGMESLSAWKWGAILVVTAAIAALLLLISRVVRGFARVLIRFIDRFVPRAVSATAGVVITFFVVVGLIQGFLLDPAMEALNAAYSVINDGTEPGIAQPSQSERSGSPASLVPWETLGTKGRNFIGSGPTRAEISGFTDRPAEEPIRVYVGIDSADSLAARVDLAMAELDRTDAWSREVITVFTTTGTGWVDAKAADPVEYMHNGDTALVALQYSFLPSWISFLVDADKAADAGREMIGAIRERIADMPKDDRPKLLLFGESLGSFGTEQAFDGIDDMISSVDGALLAGPVFQNEIHSAVTDARDSESPFWRPVYEGGEDVRFAVDVTDLAEPDTEWGFPRIVYLQNATDPITYWEPSLLWQAPEWLDEPRGPDVSDDMAWMPVVTFWQTAADMIFSTGVPAGHGHSYGANPVDAWAAIAPPQDWSAEKNQQLRDIVGDD
ncbi:MAG TPA: alpha/beta-hydrolase family protein [Microthrixaceae bacterium]|nr:alpha/beta-hydrolase family protein [Microthrixaceae bacterium]